MNLTGKQLVEQGIITNVTEECIQQHGCDTQLIKVERMIGIGFIPKEGKTELVQYEEVDFSIHASGKQYWHLTPGAYSVTMKQGCKVPSDKMLLIRQRSSMLRNGALLHSSVFDSGYSCSQIGTVIIVVHPIEIEYGARIAQIYAHNSNEVENLYNGQFQGK